MASFYDLIKSPTVYAQATEHLDVTLASCIKHLLNSTTPCLISDGQPDQPANHMWSTGQRYWMHCNHNDAVTQDNQLDHWLFDHQTPHRARQHPTCLHDACHWSTHLARFDDDKPPSSYAHPWSTGQDLREYDMICKRLITKPGIECGLRSIGLMPKDSATSLIASVSIPRQGVAALIYHGPGRRTIFQRVDHIAPLHGFKRFHYGGRDLRERHQKKWCKSL